MKGIKIEIFEIPTIVPTESKPKRFPSRQLGALGLSFNNSFAILVDDILFSVGRFLLRNSVLLLIVCRIVLGNQDPRLIGLLPDRA
jgi:hypothetical protein